jgi:hypothetical protein
MLLAPLLFMIQHSRVKSGLTKNPCMNVYLHKNNATQRNTLKGREMIFVQPFFHNFCDTFFSSSHIHIMFLLSLSVALVFVSILFFLCKIIVVLKIVNQIVVQITQL